MINKWKPLLVGIILITIKYKNIGSLLKKYYLTINFILKRKVEYVSNKFPSAQNNMKEYWACINKLTSNRKQLKLDTQIVRVLVLFPFVQYKINLLIFLNGVESIKRDCVYPFQNMVICKAISFFTLKSQLKISKLINIMILKKSLQNPM